MTPMTVALERVVSAVDEVRKVRAVSGEQVQVLPSQQTSGRVLAADVIASVDVPSRPCSRLDGYAVDISRIQPCVSYRVSSSPVRAGERPGLADATTGSVTYITTGGVLPDDANTVIMVEYSERTDGAGASSVLFTKVPPRGEGVRPSGSDVRSGSILFEAGHTLTAADVGSLILARVKSVQVMAPPSVAIISTGDEIAAAARSGGEPDSSAHGERSEPVWDANGPMLAQLVNEWGGNIVSQDSVADDFFMTEHAIARAATSGAHIVVITGGVSMGDHDFVKPALERLAAGTSRFDFGASDYNFARVDDHYGRYHFARGDVHFGRLLMKPGKPAMLATLRWNGPARSDACTVLALPGNPVSAYVCALVLLRPALRFLLGVPASAASFPRVAAALEKMLPLDAERPEFHRAMVWVAEGGGLMARSTGPQASSRLSSVSHANALLWLPQATPGCSELPAGSKVETVMFGPLLARAPPRDETNIPASGDCPCGSAQPILPTSPIALARGARPVHSFDPPKLGVRIGILTVSDSAAHGAAGDESGSLAARLLCDELCVSEPPLRSIVPDEFMAICNALETWAAPLDGGSGPRCDLIVTTGGTGFGLRDVTPEATAAVLTKRAPGLVAAMLAAGLAVTPRAALSRPEAGVREGCGRGNRGTLIINLPGSPKAVKEALTPLLPILSHALALVTQSLSS